MAINLSATEAVDLVCDDVFDCEREREGVQELYSYRRGTTVENRELTCSLKLSFHYRLRKLLVFNLRATRAL